MSNQFNFYSFFITVIARGDIMNNVILMKYDKLIDAISKKFYGESSEDLKQAGYVGLMKAYRNYNKNSNTKFSTYAYNYIFGEMYETTLKSRQIYLSREALKLYKKLNKVRELLTQKYGRNVSYNEVCDHLNIDKAKVRDILLTYQEPAIVEEIDIGSSGIDLDTKMLIRDSIGTLSDEERSIIEKRYFDDYTQVETAKVLGLSQVKVSRLEKSGREKIKSYINS